MVIVLFCGDKIKESIYFNGNIEETYLYAKQCECTHYDIVTENTYNWKYKN